MSKSLPPLAFESSSLVDLLRRCALNQPEQRGYTFLVDGESEEAYLTYGELDRRARGIAAQLQSLDAAGARVLLLYPPGLDYLAAFFGCLYAGAVAVPAYPPRLNRPEPRLQAIVADAQATVALTTQAIFSNLERRFSQTPELKALRWLATDELPEASAEAWREPSVSRETLAFLQYTSGSTAAPKGVMVSHGNLLHNLSLIYRCYEHDEESRGVIWLPPYHDMGLIGGILQPLYGGFPVTLLAPIAFLQSPHVWLQAISRCRATTSGGPNFAYDLCVRKITPEQRANLDLSSWSVAFTGAEPIQPETMEQFTQTFEVCGFRREAFYPCYGLAEATLIVSGGAKTASPVTQTVDAKALENHRVIVVKDEGPLRETKDEGPSAKSAKSQIPTTHQQPTTSDQPPTTSPQPPAPSSRSLVSCGKALPDQKILIVNPETHAQCSAEAVGEIWAAGPSIAQGYWNRTEETERTFQARLADTGEAPFLRTGDLGFIQDGELFVTGRLKDLIIIRGRNHYPQDIELTVERSHPALQVGSGAAFSVDASEGRGERLVVVQELARQARNADVGEVARAVRQAVAEQHELQVSAVVLLKPGHIPRTSSGKIQRHACRAGFLAETLEVVGRSLIDEAVEETETSSPGTHLTRAGLLALEPEERRPLLENYLRPRVAHVVHLAPSSLNPEQPLIALGLDSLMSVELKSSLENDFGVSVPLESFLNGMSLAQLVTHLLDQIPMVVVSESAQAIQPVSRMEALSLSFEQERLWLLDQIRPGNTAYNLPTVLRLTGDLNPAALEHSLNEIVRRHESLRLTFSTANARPAPIIASTLTLSLPLEDVSLLPESEREAAALRLAAEEIQRSFNLAHGPLLRAKLIRLDEQAHVLVLVLHHIVGDLWSTVLLVQELAALYESFSTGKPPTLSELSIQYLDFAHWQRQNWQSEVLQEPLAYWKKQLANAPPLLELPTDHPRPEIQSFRGAYQTFTLPATLSQSLSELSQAEGVTVFMALLAAFYALLQRYSGQTDIVVGAPIAGRDRPELRGLIGFFAYPLVLRTDLSGNPTFRELLARVRNVALEAYAHQAVPLAEVMRAARPPRSRAHAPLFQVMFGFLNQPLETLELPQLKLSPMDVGKTTTDFDLFLTVLNGAQGLRGLLEYNADLFDSETIQQLVRAYGELLEAVIRQPEIHLSEINLPAALAARARSQIEKLALAATFTSEPIKESLNFWLKEIDLPFEVEFAPYNQVFQQLLDPASLLSQNTSGINVILIRFEDWQRFENVATKHPERSAAHPERSEAQSKEPPRVVEGAVDGRNIGEEKIERNVHDLALALKTAAERSSTPHFVFVGPASPTALADAERAAFFQRLEALLASELEKVSGVYLVTSAELAAAYPVANYYDPYGDEHGHIPYTPTFYTALGTMLARKIYALNHPPYKVIVLDCDHTLWKGVCGEDGPLGVELDPPRRALQEFMVAQQAGGKLLCLCSKNDETDVVEVFQQRTEMPLRREHLVAWRINWQPKPENLRALAEELQLGLESFIFIDDNPVECAEVEAHCPEVLTLQLPAEAERLPKFLAHVWAFDQLKVTEADRARTSLYQQNAEREQFRREALTLDDFFAGLELKIEISELTPEHVERVAQLTQRTNQFNVTTIRRTEAEIQRLCQSAELECLTVKVSDRFGDYGLVGVIMFTAQPAALRVDTFLLSCRVLGRRVENQMLVRLGEIAQARGLAHVEVPYHPTPKNKPALDFLNNVGADFKEANGDEWIFKFPVEFVTRDA